VGGVRIPINSAKDFVISPLKSLPDQPVLDQQLKTWSAASTATKNTWLKSYAKASTNMKIVKDRWS